MSSTTRYIDSPVQCPITQLTQQIMTVQITKNEEVLGRSFYAPLCIVSGANNDDFSDFDGESIETLKADNFKKYGATN